MASKQPVLLWPWVNDQKTLTITREFENFNDAMQFVNLVAGCAQRLDHHPKITIDYNKVNLELTTHDVEGVTDKDMKLANEIEKSSSETI